MRSIMLILLTVFACSAIAVERAPNQRTLALTGSADIKAQPNIAYMSIAVSTQGMTAKDAITQNAVKMKAVVAALQKVLEKDGKLQTGRYQVTPSYQYDDKTRKSSLTGYEATNQLRIETKDLTSVGTLIDAAASAGSNQMQSLQFTHTEMESLTMQATLMAIQRARVDAAQMAEVAGVKLGNIVSIDTMNSGPGPGPLYKAERMMMASSDAQTPVVPGEITVTGSVAITYELQ